MPRRVVHDMDVSTMRYMRDTLGLSSTEIAQQLDVSRVTVVKYLGPGGPRKPRAKAEDPGRTTAVPDRPGITRWFRCSKCGSCLCAGDKYCHECGRKVRWL